MKIQPSVRAVFSATTVSRASSRRGELAPWSAYRIDPKLSPSARNSRPAELNVAALILDAPNGDGFNHRWTAYQVEDASN
jgi:hypothetical protein